MTAPAKTTGAKRGRKPNQAPPVKVDFSAVSVTDGGNISRQGASALDGTPVLAWLQDSWATKTERTITDPETKVKREVHIGKAKSVTVPKEQAPSMTNLLRMGARRLGLGLRVVPGKVVDGKVTIVFAAKTPRATKPRAPKA